MPRGARILVADAMKPAVIDALEARLATITLGDPAAMMLPWAHCQRRPES